MMVHGGLFILMDLILRIAKGNNLPFGGIQLILAGDPYQVPIVKYGEDEDEVSETRVRSEFINMNGDVLGKKKTKERFPP